MKKEVSIFTAKEFLIYGNSQIRMVKHLFAFHIFFCHERIFLSESFYKKIKMFMKYEYYPECTIIKHPSGISKMFLFKAC